MDLDLDLELVSFKLCPFVQRAVITLLQLRVPYRIQYIDLDAPPEWFLRISPFGKVPILIVDHRTVLFESAVIIQFIDEVAGGTMQPREPLRRALNRAWIEFGAACLADNHDLMTAVDEPAFEITRLALRAKLAKLDEFLKIGPYFNGETLSLVDAALAPLFMRLELLGEVFPVYQGSELPRVASWSRTLLSLPAVRDSVVPEFRDLFFEFIRSKKGYVASLL